MKATLRLALVLLGLTLLVTPSVWGQQQTPRCLGSAIKIDTLSKLARYNENGQRVYEYTLEITTPPAPGAVSQKRICVAKEGEIPTLVPAPKPPVPLPPMTTLAHPDTTPVAAPRQSYVPPMREVRIDTVRIVEERHHSAWPWVLGGLAVAGGIVCAFECPRLIDRSHSCAVAVATAGSNATALASSCDGKTQTSRSDKRMRFGWNMAVR